MIFWLQDRIHFKESAVFGPIKDNELYLVISIEFQLLSTDSVY